MATNNKNDTIFKETFLITIETTNHFQIGSLSLKIKSSKHYQPTRRTGGKSSEATQEESPGITTTGTDDLSFQVKFAVNDINEVVKRFLTAAEEKERDFASKKVIKTIFSIFSDPDQ